MSDICSNEQDAGRCLMLVHGKDFKPSAEDYLDSSLAALVAGLERDFPDALEQFRALSKRICYYGDLTNHLLAYYGQHFDDALDMGDRRNALAQLNLLSKRKHFGVGRYDRLPGKTAFFEFAADISATLLALFGFSKPLLARTSKDIAEYWYGKNDFAESLRARVREKICDALDRDEDILLISHGSGSIVTYDVLWQLSHDERFSDRYADKKIGTWITLGAPLGDFLVRRRLAGARQRGHLKYPCNVVTWHNISAEDDYLCHDNTLADDFKPMLKQRLISSIRDYKIYNLSVRYGKSCPHSSLGYYIHPRVSQVIVEWLNSSSAEQSPQNIL